MYFNQLLFDAVNVTQEMSHAFTIVHRVFMTMNIVINDINIVNNKLLQESLSSISLFVTQWTICNPLLHLRKTVDAEEESLALQLWVWLLHRTVHFRGGLSHKGVHYWGTSGSPRRIWNMMLLRKSLKQQPKPVASVPWPGIGRGNRTDGCASDDWAAGRVDETQFNSLDSATGPRRATC